MRYECDICGNVVDTEFDIDGTVCDNCEGAMMLCFDDGEDANIIDEEDDDVNIIDEDDE